MAELGAKAHTMRKFTMAFLLKTFYEIAKNFCEQKKKVYNHRRRSRKVAKFRSMEKCVDSFHLDVLNSEQFKIPFLQLDNKR